MQSREEFLATRKRYWQENKDRLNAERRHRRAEDPEYREILRAREKAKRDKKRAESPKPDKPLKEKIVKEKKKPFYKGAIAKRRDMPVSVDDPTFELRAPTDFNTLDISPDGGLTISEITDKWWLWEDSF